MVSAVRGFSENKISESPGLLDNIKLLWSTPLRISPSIKIVFNFCCAVVIARLDDMVDLPSLAP